MTHDQRRERTEVHSAFIGSPLPATTSYTTSIDMLALEQKLEVLVAEATTTISSRLLAHIAYPATVSTEAVPVVGASSTKSDSHNQVSTISAGPRESSTAPMKRRRGKTRAQTSVIKSPSSPPDDQFVTQKRPVSQMSSRHLFVIFVVVKNSSPHVSGIDIIHHFIDKLVGHCLLHLHVSNHYTL